MEVTPYFIFYCDYCCEIRRVIGDKNLKKANFKYLGEVNGFYETHIDCPICSRHHVFKHDASLR